MHKTRSRLEKWQGLLIGTAVGDALGLPKEGLSPLRIKAIFPGKTGHTFFLGKGMVSDDTEHTALVCLSLHSCPKDEHSFGRCLAWKLKRWLLTIPAGVGSATLRGLLKSAFGFSPDNSGVYAAGNGPAMRSAPIGAFFDRHETQMRSFVKKSTRITHTDPRAEIAALAVAKIAAWCFQQKSEIVKPSVAEISALLTAAMSEKDEEWATMIKKMEEGWHLQWSPETFSHSLGLKNGVTGYSYHSVPVAIYTWYYHFGNYEAVISEVIALGGDTDSVAAIAGGLTGALCGCEGIPAHWQENMTDWPWSLKRLKRLGEALCSEGVEKPSMGFFPAVLLRNLCFFLIVLMHGCRRLLPPYAAKNTGKDR